MKVIMDGLYLSQGVAWGVFKNNLWNGWSSFNQKSTSRMVRRKKYIHERPEYITTQQAYRTFFICCNDLLLWSDK